MQLAESENIAAQDEVDRVELDDEYQPLVVPRKLYAFFVANAAEGGMDAFLVMTHLLYTAGLQGTNQPRASVEYIEKSLGMPAARVKAAKAFLAEHRIIT